MSHSIRTLAVLALATALLVGMAAAAPAAADGHCSCSSARVSVAGTDASVSVSGDGQAVRVSVGSGSTAQQVDAEATAGNVVVDVGSGSAAVVVDGEVVAANHVEGQEVRSRVEVRQRSSVSVVQHVSRASAGHDDEATVRHGAARSGGDVAVRQAVSRSVDAGPVHATDCLAWSLWRLGLGVSGLFRCP